MSSNLFLTLVIAFVIIVFAIALLAIGWLITGKTRIEKGCGKDPTKKKDKGCHTCDVCELSPPLSEETAERENSNARPNKDI